MGFFKAIGKGAAKVAKWAVGHKDDLAAAAEAGSTIYKNTAEARVAKKEYEHTYHTEQMWDELSERVNKLEASCAEAFDALEEKNGELTAQIESVQEELMQEIQSCSQKLSALQTAQEEYRHEMNGKLIVTGVVLGVGLFITFVIAIFA